MIHYRAVVHIAAKDGATAEAIARRIDKLSGVKPDAPFVTVLALERRPRPPGERGWR